MSNHLLDQATSSWRLARNKDPKDEVYRRLVREDGTECELSPGVRRDSEVESDLPQSPRRRLLELVILGLTREATISRQSRPRSSLGGCDSREVRERRVVQLAIMAVPLDDPVDPIETLRLHHKPSDGWIYRPAYKLIQKHVLKGRRPSYKQLEICWDEPRAVLDDNDFSQPTTACSDARSQNYRAEVVDISKENPLRYFGGDRWKLGAKKGKSRLLVSIHAGKCRPIGFWADHTTNLHHSYSKTLAAYDFAWLRSLDRIADETVVPLLPAFLLRLDTKNNQVQQSVPTLNVLVQAHSKSEGDLGILELLKGDGLASPPWLTANRTYSDMLPTDVAGVISIPQEEFNKLPTIADPWKESHKGQDMLVAHIRVAPPLLPYVCWCSIAPASIPEKKV